MRFNSAFKGLIWMPFPIRLEPLFTPIQCPFSALDTKFFNTEGISSPHLTHKYEGMNAVAIPGGARL
jgi:hypothetical protein